jgi:hypothetical protein
MELMIALLLLRRMKSLNETVRHEYRFTEGDLQKMLGIKGHIKNVTMNEMEEYQSISISVTITTEEYK